MLRNHSESFPLHESDWGPLVGYILGLTVEAKLTGKEQKPGLATRRESVSLCRVLGGVCLLCKMVSPTHALFFVNSEYLL